MGRAAESMKCMEYLCLSVLIYRHRNSSSVCFVRDIYICMWKKLNEPN